MRNLLLLLALASLLICGYAKSVNWPVWEDLQFPISGVNPVGPATSDARDTHTGAIRLLAYDIHYIREANGSFGQYGDTQ